MGILANVGRFTAVDGVDYARGSRVICRTKRGLETGEVLALADRRAFDADGALLRRITLEDDLLLARLECNRMEAYTACAELIEQRGIPAVLMEVEHLFDGRSLYFYFLGDTTPELETITADLATAYDTAVQFRKFAETVNEGCGVGCGTPEAVGSGCGSGGCSTCSVSSACGTKAKH